MEQLLVGVGQEVITPKIGAMLLGYTPMRPALSVHDDLHVTAFAFETNGVQALYLAADLCNMYYPELELRQAISQATGVPAEHMVVSCTHTHSGPHTGKNEEDTFFYMEDIFIPACIKASNTALENTLAQVKRLGDPEKLKGIPLGCYTRLMERAEFLCEGNIPETERVINRTVIAVGPVAFMPLPFEPFSMITLRIKDHSPFPYTLCPGYSNGAMSYFPSMDQIPRGGYEVMLFCCRDFPFAEDAENHLVAGCLKLLRELYEQ